MLYIGITMAVLTVGVAFLAFTPDKDVWKLVIPRHHRIYSACIHDVIVVEVTIITMLVPHNSNPLKYHACSF
jgi:hypothetical protein